MEKTAVGAGGALALSLGTSSSSPAASKEAGIPRPYLRRIIRTPIINSHVHILPLLEYKASQLIEEMDRTGQDLAIFHLMDKVPDPRRTTRQYLEEGKSYVEEYPGRLIPFIGIHPGNPEALQLVEIAVRDYGVVGFGEMIFSLWAKNKVGKAYGLDHEILPTDKKYCWPFFQKLSDLGAVALIDATQVDGGDGIGYSRADHFEEIARAFPKLAVVIGGACITSDYTGKNTEKCISLCQTYDNVYLDIHDWQVVEDTTGKFAAHGFQKRGGIKVLYTFLRSLLDHPRSRSKVLFGSDWPLANLMIGLDELQWLRIILEKREESGIFFTQEEWEKFFGMNALGFLKKNRYFNESKYPRLTQFL